MLPSIVFMMLDYFLYGDIKRYYVERFSLLQISVLMYGSPMLHVSCVIPTNTEGFTSWTQTAGSVLLSIGSLCIRDGATVTASCWYTSVFKLVSLLQNINIFLNTTRNLKSNSLYLIIYHLFVTPVKTPYYCSASLVASCHYVSVLLQPTTKKRSSLLYYDFVK